MKGYRHLIGFLIVLPCLIFQLYGQKKAKSRKNIERTPRQELSYDNKTYTPSIRSVQFHPLGKESALPIIELNSDDRLQLQFDDLRGDIRDFYFSIEYCDADWSPSKVSRIDYADGFNEDRIVDIHSSIATYQPYTNYRLVFPNQYVRPKLAGNYIIKVYEDADKERLILSRKFYVLKNIMGIDSKIGPSPIVSNRSTHQKINLTISTASLSVQNPQRDLKISVMQNQREDNMMATDQPSNLDANSIKYDLMNTLDFMANNEFRYVDLRSLKLGSEGVKSISIDTLSQIELYPDEDHSKDKYASTFDENGNFYIRNLDQNDDHLQGDYANVTFYLNAPQHIHGKIYLIGKFNNFKTESENQLTFDKNLNLWKITMKLKQGLYDYEYIFVDQNGKKHTDKFSGSHFETGNEYQILVYNRRPGTYWDELVGFNELGINNRK